MNLKEAFRYQNFLEFLMNRTHSQLTSVDHCLIKTLKHLKSKANPEVEDFIEQPEIKHLCPHDTLISFMSRLIEEKMNLTCAIGKAKASLDFDLDAAVATNKFRQNAHNSIQQMLARVPSVSIIKGQDYKFNNEGNQVPYYYDVEVTTVEAYDKKDAKNLMRSLIQEADNVSNQIDAAMINAVVDYVPPFDVNDSFEDVIESYMNM